MKEEWFNNKNYKISEGLPVIFADFVKIIIDLKFDQEPNYFDLVSKLLKMGYSYYEIKWNNFI